MNTWMSFLLPADEYKEKRLLYFISEGAIIQFISSIVMIICNKFINLGIETILLTCIAIFLFYVSGRYIMSGIEYTDVATKKAYTKELKVISIRTVTFVMLYMVVSFLFIGFPADSSDWLDTLGLLLSIGIVMFFFNYISLKRSYKKNRELV
jgi:uncharacterized membrane-anchored protein